MKKKIAAFILALGALIAALPLAGAGAPADGAAYAVRMGEKTGYVLAGESLTAEIFISSGTEREYAGLDAVVRYDGSKLSFVSASGLSGLVSNAENGELSLAWVGAQSVPVAEGAALTLTFMAADTFKSGETAITIESAAVSKKGQLSASATETGGTVTALAADGLVTSASASGASVGIKLINGGDAVSNVTLAVCGYAADGKFAGMTTKTGLAAAANARTETVYADVPAGSAEVRVLTLDGETLTPLGAAVSPEAEG